MRYTAKCTRARMSLAHLLTMSVCDSSSQIFLNWQKTRKHLLPCQISCLSWNTLIRWTPGSRRPGRAETSSMRSTGAAWRIFTLLFTTGCTATSTRSVQFLLRRLGQDVRVPCGVPQTFWMTLTKLMFQTHVLCAELGVWRGDVPHQWPQHGSPLQPPQQRLAGEPPRPAAQLRRPVWSHWSPRCQVPGEEKRCGTSLTYTWNQDPEMETWLPLLLPDSEHVDRQRSRAKNSEGGEVPHKYFVVTNNQLLRVKYLLLYSQRRHLSR